jgi:hypothetical protein
MNAVFSRSRGFLRHALLSAVIGIGLFALSRTAQAQYPYHVSQTRVVYGPRSWTVYTQAVGTGVYVNGRQLTPYQVAQLRQVFGYVAPGSYWLRRDGTYGRVGGPALGNLYLAAQAARNQALARSRSRINHHSRGTLVVPGAGVLLPDGTSVTW